MFDDEICVIHCPATRDGIRTFIEDMNKNGRTSISVVEETGDDGQIIRIKWD